MAIASPTAENIEKSERFIAEVFDGRDRDALDEFCATDCVVHGVPGEPNIETSRASMRTVSTSSRCSRASPT